MLHIAESFCCTTFCKQQFATHCKLDILQLKNILAKLKQIWTLNSQLS